MSGLQDQYDEAMFAFSTGDYDSAIAQLRAVLTTEPTHFESQLALGMAYYRKGDYQAAITEGLKAAQLRPHEQLVHTNLSLFYMKAGDKAAAEHHGLQSRIASWRTEAKRGSNAAAAPADPELQIARPKPQPVKFPEMPWKKAKPQ